MEPIGVLTMRRIPMGSSGRRRSFDSGMYEPLAPNAGR